MKDLKSTVAKNLVECRRAMGITQLQLAEKLNYSDKAVSKWERGESLPDVTVLYELAQLYGVTLDYLVTEHAGAKPVVRKEKKRRHFLITLMSCLLVWLIATAVFSILLISGKTQGAWLVFIWALPISGIVCIVFSCIWGNKYHRAVSVSGVIWSLALALFLTVRIDFIWLVFVISIPLQALTIFWFILKAQKTK